MPELYKQQILFILFFLKNIFVVFSVYSHQIITYAISIATMAHVPSASAQLLQLPVGHVSHSRY